ncbi:C-terminal binding protein [Sphingopyxis sp. GC21]|uniref:C-terminal binding protein n=1 Tax=Sphingopyxis sp. GC21 TaxID=2933562 RepID=UPI0021E43665|nr:C-terminal binding protein [Sphingopyxis sp. GC21]
MAIVFQTDYAWPDDSIERAVIEGAGHKLFTGPAVPASAEEIVSLVERYRPQAIMTCWAQVSGRAIAAAENLLVVQRIGVGLDNIDVEAATDFGAWVTNVPDYCVGEVSDHAIALLLDWARGTVAFDREVKAGRWDPAAAKLRRVADLTVGVVGLGRIGRATVTRLEGFGCALLAHDPYARESGAARLVALDALLEASDVVILHVPLTAGTHHLMDAARLAQMRPGAFLINVSRGPLVDNDALLAALEQGRLSGAGLDVVEGEPDPPRALVERADVVVTPHVAFSSEASLAELRRRSAEEVVRVLGGGRPQNPCNNPGA